MRPLESGLDLATWEGASIGETLNATTRMTVVSADLGLSHDVLGVFTRACTEGRYEVAEHLLRALEAMEAPLDPGNGQIHHTAVAAAYRVLMDLPETEADPRVRHV